MMQTDGYSLDAQSKRLHDYANYRNMYVVREYSDKGHSGKNIQGRPQFKQMLEDIERGSDNVDFVLVYKLSRFGRNAADVLSSLQNMQDYGVNLICIEDGIDSSKDSGKLVISILSAVAEVERENILVQTMEGRRQKAREGKWNGGFAPYGYKLVEGKLLIDEDEAQIVRIIYDKFVNTTMGSIGISAYLNEQGYVKSRRQNNSIDMFSAFFVRLVLDNPVYYGKIAYGRRKTVKVEGKRNEYRIEKQKEYPLYDGQHVAIISEEMWKLAQRKRQQTGIKQEKVYSLEHENILSGILRCPNCGGPMYGNVNRKRKSDGSTYKDYFYYACKHRTTVNGHRCGYRKQWKQEKINAAVEEVIRKLVENPNFEKAIREKISSEVNTVELQNKHTQLKKKINQLNNAKTKLGQQIDNLDMNDEFYNRKYEDMNHRLNKLYSDIYSTELQINDVEERIFNVEQEKISEDNVYQFLLYFDKLYDKFSDGEKKEFLSSFIEEIEIYPAERSNGQVLKSITFRFPVFFEGNSVKKISWDKETTVETCMLFQR